MTIALRSEDALPHLAERGTICMSHARESVNVSKPGLDVAVARGGQHLQRVDHAFGIRAVHPSTKRISHVGSPGLPRKKSTKRRSHAARPSLVRLT
jgi:hypothetical protein